MCLLSGFAICGRFEVLVFLSSSAVVDLHVCFKIKIVLFLTVCVNKCIVCYELFRIAYIFVHIHIHIKSIIFEVWYEFAVGVG